MKIERFDPLVARANGYEIVTLPDGRVGSVPRLRSSGAGQSPHNVVYGDCGESWVLLFDDPIQEGRYDLDTGFRVNGPAVDYQWRVHVEKSGAPRQNREHSGGRPLNGHWADSFNVKAPMFGEGSHRATVVPTRSFVILEDGGVCYSGGPWDEAYVD